MFNKLTMALAAAALVLASPSAASAATVITVFKGYVAVANGDPERPPSPPEFGLPNTGLAGLPFKATVYADTAAVANVLAPDPGYAEYQGGGPTSPLFLTATLEINGVSQTFDGVDFASIIRSTSVYGYDQIIYQLEERQGGPQALPTLRRVLFFSMIDYDTPFVPTTDITQPLHYVAPPDSYNTAGGAFIYAFTPGVGITRYLDAILIPTEVTVGGAVPEPATWIGMIAGLAGLGGALRRAGRRRAA